MRLRVLRAAGLIMALLLLAACNLNTTGEPIGGGAIISGAPEVRIAAPPPNATFLEGVTVSIQALVSNAGPDIDRVEIAVDDTLIHTLDDPNSAGAPAFSVQQTWTAAGVGAHTLTVTAIRADGSASTPATVTFSVVAQGGAGASAEASPTSASPTSGGGNGAAPTTQNPDPAQPAATSTPPPPTEPPAPQATATPNVPTASFTTGVNVRSGPDVLFNPPIGSFAAGESTPILAVNPAGTWYKVRYYNGEGWVFGNLMTVSGDINSLPRDPGPPVPTLTPLPPTPVPVTATPSLNINLVAGNIRLDPNQPACNATFNIFFDVANFGQNRSPGGSISVENFAPSGAVERTAGAFPEIDPGQTISVGPIPITISVNFEEEHRLRLTIDPNNQIAETNESDNVRELSYRLARGGC